MIALPILRVMSQILTVDAIHNGKDNTEKFPIDNRLRGRRR